MEYKTPDGQTIEIGNTTPDDIAPGQRLPAPESPGTNPTTGKPLPPKVTKPLYAYPHNLKSEMRDEPFVQIRVVDPFTRARKSKFNLALPMPTSMRVSYNSIWEDITMNHIANAMAEGLQGTTLEGLWNSLKSAATGDLSKLGLGRAASVAGGVGTDAIIAGFNYNGLQATAQAQIIARIAVNPHAALLFNNMAFREFQLRFTLMAKNYEDDKNIRDIIFQLKYCMHPDFSENASALGHTYYNIPENFIINFYAPNLHSLVRTHPCALINLDVEYNGAGVPTYFDKSHRPVCYILTLHFKELSVVTKTDIQKGW